MDITLGENLFTTLGRKLYEDMDIRRLHDTPRVPQELSACIASLTPLARLDARKSVLIVHTRCSIIRAEGVAMCLSVITMLVEAFLRGVSGTSCPAAVKVSK